MIKLTTIVFLTTFGIVLILNSCTSPDTSLIKEEVGTYEVNQFLSDSIFLPYRDTIYIPIYSEIHMEHDTRKLELTVTLSIRNTSLVDTIYLNDINQYDARGKIVREYLDDLMFLTPMQSTNYVIEEDENEKEVEGSFMVNWGATNSEVVPIFQAVMISAHGPQGISFVTDGVSVGGNTKR